ncbi:MAG: nitrilase-related carbon-nitrogen hydrolase, partial [Candidatus Nitrotoga sp.]
MIDVNSTQKRIAAQKQSFKVAAVQMASGPNVANNLNEAERLVEKAVEQGARLVVLPEYFPVMGLNDMAKVAVRGRKNYDELLSPASIGLLAAIDRYVPNAATSARFGYFANYWIRYHVSRYTQKTNGVVPLSINQQRIVRKIDRLIEQ